MKIKEAPYQTAAECTAFLDGLTEVFDEDVTAIGTRPRLHHGDFVAAFLDHGFQDLNVDEDGDE